MVTPHRSTYPIYIYIYICTHNNLTVRLHRSSVILVHSLYRAPVVSVSGRKALCIGAWHSLCRAPTLCVGAQRSLCQGPALSGSVSSLCRAWAVSMLGPGALCVGAWRSLCRGPALFLALTVSGPSAVCVGARRSLSGSAVFYAHSLCRASAVCASVPASALFVSGPGADLCRALFLSGPGALSVGSLCPGALCWGLCRGLSVPPGTLCVRTWRSLCRGPALFVSGRPAMYLSGLGGLYVGARRSVSGPGALCVGARALCRAPARFVSGPGADLCWALFVAGPGAPCVGARRICQAWAVSVSAPGALCRAPALFVSGPALCVGARRSLCRDPALSVGSRRRGPAVLSQDSVCQVPAVCVSGPSAFCLSGRSFCRGPALCVAAQRSLCQGPALCVGALYAGAGQSVCRGPALFVSGPGALCVGAQRSLCRGPAQALAGALCVGAVCVRPACHPALTRVPLLIASHLSGFTDRPSSSDRATQLRSAPHPAPRAHAPIRVQAPTHPNPGLLPSTCHGIRVRPQLQSACHPSGPAAHPRATCGPSSHRRWPPADPRATCATHPAPRAPSSDPRATHPAPGPPSSNPRATLQPRAPFSKREPQTLLFGGKVLLLQNFLHAVIARRLTFAPPLYGKRVPEKNRAVLISGVRPHPAFVPKDMERRGVLQEGAHAEKCRRLQFRIILVNAEDIQEDRSLTLPGHGSHNCDQRSCA